MDNIFLACSHRVPLYNSASMRNCHWVQGRSNKYPHLPPKWGYLFHDFTSFFSFIYIQECVNEIILYMPIGWKDLSTCITDDITAGIKDDFVQKSAYIYVL